MLRSSVMLEPLDERWVVAVATVGGVQRYVCDAIEQARRWEALLQAPVRERPRRGHGRRA